MDGERGRKEQEIEKFVKVGVTGVTGGMIAGRESGSGGGKVRLCAGDFPT